MTKEEFFTKWDELVDSDSFIGEPDDDFRLLPIRFRFADGEVRCPVTGMCKYAKGLDISIDHYAEAGCELGLDVIDAIDIVLASDYTSDVMYAKLRQRLLKPMIERHIQP